MYRTETDAKIRKTSDAYIQVTKELFFHGIYIYIYRFILAVLFIVNTARVAN